jgi:cell division septal protein FtsQ
MLISAAAIYGVGASPAFDYTKMQLEGVQFTDPAAVESALSAARGENLFRLSTGPLLAELERLPTVDHARIDVRLPATLAVTIDEREPILVWRAGDARYLAAADGTLFAKLGDAPGGAAAGLPEVVDSDLHVIDRISHARRVSRHAVRRDVGREPANHRARGLDGAFDPGPMAREHLAAEMHR